MWASFPSPLSNLKKNLFETCRGYTDTYSTGCVDTVQCFVLDAVQTSKSKSAECDWMRPDALRKGQLAVNGEQGPDLIDLRQPLEERLEG